MAKASISPTSSSTPTFFTLIPLIFAPLVHGWMPRLSSTSCTVALKSASLANGVRSGGGGQPVLLSMSNGFEGDDLEKEKESSSDDHHWRFDDERRSLFAEDEFHNYVSRLEAIYGMTSDSPVEEAGGKSSKPFWQDEDRLVLEGWMDLTEGPCLDDCCGFDCDEQCEIPEEYKLSDTPKVDVMSFLGIRRAEPLRVGRDWD